VPRAEGSDDDAPCSISLRRGTENLTSQSSSHSRRRVHETAIVRAKRIDASPRRVRRPSRPPERLAGRAFERMSRVNTIGIKSENAPPRRARRRSARTWILARARAIHGRHSARPRTLATETAVSNTMSNTMGLGDGEPRGEETRRDDATRASGRGVRPDERMDRSIV